MRSWRFLLLLSTLLFIHCQNDAVFTKYAHRYQQLRKELINSDSLIEYTLSKKNLPPYQVLSFNKQKSILTSHSLSDLLEKQQKKESEISNLIQETTTFLSAIHQNEFFTPDSLQIKQFELLQDKIKPYEKIIRNDSIGFVKDGKTFVKILDHDLEVYLSKTLTNPSAFSDFLDKMHKEFDDIKLILETTQADNHISPE